MRFQLALCALLLIQRAAPAPQPAASNVNAPATLTVTASDEQSAVPIPGVTVVAVRSVAGGRPLTELRGVTDESGRVSLGDVAPASYTVAATAPDGFDATGPGVMTSRGHARSVVVTPGDRRVVAFTFRHHPAISGFVEAADGKAAAGIRIELVRSSGTVHERPIRSLVQTATSDASGRFAFNDLQPGQYFVRAMPPAPPGPLLNFVYAPGSATLRDALPLQLDGGEARVGLTLRSVPAVTVSGHVVHVNGQPAAHSTITLSALDRTVKTLSVPTVGPGSELAYAARTDGRGNFSIPSVLEGLYVLRAVARRDENSAISAASVVEIAVGTTDVADLELAMALPARLTGRFIFNGAEEPDPGRTQLAMVPDGEHGHVLKGLATAGAWRADGRFEVDGVFGSQRLTLGSTGNWFIERATLEDGTDIAARAHAFAAGRTYANVRVWLSDQVATVGGALPSWWDPHEGMVIVMFPEDPALRGADSQLVRPVSVSTEARRFSVTGLPTGEAYLVVAFFPADFQDWLSEATFAALTPFATRVVATEPQVYDVTLNSPVRR